MPGGPISRDRRNSGAMPQDRPRHDSRAVAAIPPPYRHYSSSRVEIATENRGRIAGTQNETGRG